jgi:hypothetical protein
LSVSTPIWRADSQPPCRAIDVETQRAHWRFQRVVSSTFLCGTASHFWPDRAVWAAWSQTKRGLPACSLLTHDSLYGARNRLQDAV